MAMTIIIIRECLNDIDMLLRQYQLRKCTVHRPCEARIRHGTALVSNVTDPETLLCQ